MRTAGVLLLALVAACSSTTAPPDAPEVRDAAEPCPTEPPTDGTSCSGTFSCLWERCPEAGVVSATCSSGRYTVTTSACEDHDCRGVTTCGAEAICVERQGGALLVECAPNPCGDGPITASCACAACDGFPCTANGRGVLCNTCTSGICP